jgi:hypothetical protein
MKKHACSFAVLLALGGAATAQQGAQPAAKPPGQVPQTVPGTVGKAPGTLVPQPFFQNQQVQQQLRLQPDQLRRMNEAFGQLSGQFRDPFSQIGKLNEQQRAERLRQLSGQFNTQLNQSFGNILNEQQMQRFNQLQLQQQGFSLFQDPRLRNQLSLTPQQMEQLAKASKEFDQQLLEVNQLAQTNQTMAERRFNELNQRQRERINSILNDQQRQTYRGMVGDPFNFPYSSTIRP